MENLIALAPLTFMVIHYCKQGRNPPLEETVMTVEITVSLRAVQHVSVIAKQGFKRQFSIIFQALILPTMKGLVF